MKCTDAEALIHKELDRELSEEERGALDAHLGQCPRCAALREGMLRLAVVARDLPTERAPMVDLAGAVTATLHRRRRFRVALGTGLAAAALLLLCLTLWPPTHSQVDTVPPVGRQAVAPRELEHEVVPVVNPGEAIAWLEDAWQDARTQLEADLSSVQVSLLPEDFSWQGELQRDLEQTGSILLQVTRQVGAQVFPFGSSQADSKLQNG